MEDEQSLQLKLTEYGFDRDCHKFCVSVIGTGKGFGTIEYSRTLAEQQELFLLGMSNVETIHLENKLVLVGKNIGIEEFRDMLQKSNQRIKQRYEEVFFIALGLEVARWEDLHFSYESAKVLSERRFLFDSEDVVTLENCRASGMKKQDNMSDALFKAIEVGDEVQMQELISAQMDYYRRDIMREEEIKIFFLEALLKIYNGIKEEYPEQSKDFPSLAEMSGEIRRAKTLGKLADVMLELCQKLSCLIASDSGNIISRILSYMEKHYNEDLSLKSISETFGYNSAYLGKLFKDTTGEGFVSTLNRIRIEHAKKKILEKKLKIHQISEMVGYSDTSYFYTKFKEYVGVSPREFEAVAESD